MGACLAAQLAEELSRAGLDIVQPLALAWCVAGAIEAGFAAAPARWLLGLQAGTALCPGTAMVVDRLHCTSTTHASPARPAPRRYNEAAPPEARIRGAPDSLVVLVGNSKVVWEPFLAACAQDEGLLTSEHPFNTYVERALGACLQECAARWARCLAVPVQPVRGTGCRWRRCATCAKAPPQRPPPASGSPPPQPAPTAVLVTQAG